MISRRAGKPGKRIHIVQGGMRAGKTFAILLLIIDYALKHKNKRIAVFSHSYPHLKRGAVKDFVFIMQETSRYNESSFNKSSLIYTFETGSTVEFITTDRIESLYGTQFDLAFINEVNFVSQEVFNRVMITSAVLFVDFNPVRRFYIHDLLNREDVTFCKLTYKDNALCPSHVVRELERIKKLGETNTYWRNYYRVYGEGEIGQSIDNVYVDWKVVDVVPFEAIDIAIGIDFGFTNDPTAIVAIYYQDNTYYINELCYKQGLLAKDIANYIKHYNCKVFCDGAEPRMVEELKRLLQRSNIYGVKYKINESIDYVKSLNIKVTKASINTLNELANYTYIRDKHTNELTNDVVETNNHAMDAIRYALCGLKEMKDRSRYVETF
jgi:phage terminase large subunit